MKVSHTRLVVTEQSLKSIQEVLISVLPQPGFATSPCTSRSKDPKSCHMLRLCLCTLVSLQVAFHTTPLCISIIACLVRSQALLQLALCKRSSETFEARGLQRTRRPPRTWCFFLQWPGTDSVVGGGSTGQWERARIGVLNDGVGLIACRPASHHLGLGS